ncbi:MAG: Uma2 family endonuclease, partial [bacterium]|nr:Uma2 family endonuclease [bacterium]
RLYPNDMRVRIPRGNSYKYPDIVIVCEKPQFEDNQHDTLLNPTVIIEVLSPSPARTPFWNSPSSPAACR